jgi:hypothetical protein
MLYNPPSKWTEHLLDELPIGEDDRYERKSGAQLVEGKFDEFTNSLSKEIGAFANSFGGTLFLGIADDRTKVGVPSAIKVKKSDVPIERWLENKIPTLFEMRLQQFRIAKIEEISKETLQVLVPDRTLIAIDVFDSDLVPHQCIFDQRYYYRSNSESRPAPHHYLAFLWGRSNPNMSNVATWWLKDFLNPLIELLRAGKESLAQKRVLLRSEPVQSMIMAWNHRIDPLNKATFENLQTTPVGEYFVSLFPTLEKEVNKVGSALESFENKIDRLANDVRNSVGFLPKLKEFYTRRVQQYPNIVQEAQAWDLVETAKRLAGEYQSQISSYPDQAANNFIYLSVYQLVGLELEFLSHITPGEHTIRDVSKHVADFLLENDASVISATEDCNRTLELLHLAVSDLWHLLKKERIEIAKRYGATFQDL